MRTTGARRTSDENGALFVDLEPGAYQMRASYKLKRKKNGVWDQHSLNAKDYTVTMTEIP